MEFSLPDYTNLDIELDLYAYRSDFCYLSDYQSNPHKSIYTIVNKKVQSIDLDTKRISNYIPLACYIRPTLDVSDLTKFLHENKNYVTNFRKKKYQAVEYGYFPQKRVFRSTNNILERQYKKGLLPKTGNSYTSDKTYFEYEYKGKRYIRMEVNLLEGNYYNYKNGSPIWIEVTPIVWLYDENIGKFISRDIIVGNFPYKSFVDTEEQALAYLKSSFKKEISQTVKEERKQIIDKSSYDRFKSIAQNKTSIEENTLLNLIYKKYSRYSDKKILESLFNSNETLKLLVLTSKRIGDFANFIDIDTVTGVYLYKRLYFKNPNLPKRKLYEYYSRMFPKLEEKTDLSCYDVLLNENCPSDLFRDMVNDLFDIKLDDRTRFDILDMIAKHQNVSYRTLYHAYYQMSDYLEKMKPNYLNTTIKINEDFLDYYASLCLSNPNTNVNEMIINEPFLTEFQVKGVLDNPNCNESTFNKLFYNIGSNFYPESERFRLLGLSKSKYCTKDKLERLLRFCTNEDKRSLMIASNPYTTAEELKGIADFLSSNELTYRILSNRNCPLELLDRVSKSNYLFRRVNFEYEIGVDATIFEAIINNPNCTKELFNYIVERAKIEDSKIVNLKISEYVLTSDKSSIELMEDYFGFSLDDELDLKPTIESKNKKVDTIVKLEEEKKRSEEEKHKKELLQKKLEEEKLEKEKQERIKDVTNSLNALMNSIEALEKFNDQNALINLYHKYTIGDDILLVKVDDHYEIRSEFIRVLRFLNLSFTNTNNLKASGIDWSETNIIFNPQNVYNKDLSNAKFSDRNISGDLSGCNLSGSYIGEEVFPVGIENAITDENTVLPGGKSR